MFYKSQMHTLFQTNNCLYCPIRQIRTDCKIATGSRRCTKPHQVVTRPPYVFKKWVHHSSRTSEQPLLSYKLRITVFLQSTQSISHKWLSRHMLHLTLQTLAHHTHMCLAECSDSSSHFKEFTAGNVACWFTDMS